MIVTGAGSGFGEATAKRFASEKANVVVSDVEAASAKSVMKSRKPVAKQWVICDVSVKLIWKTL